VPRLCAIVAVALALPSLVVCAADEGGKKGGKGQAKPPADSNDAIDSICKMIPEGLRNLKVNYPGFQGGQPSSLVTAAAMTRVNPQEMFAEKLRIDLYGKEPKDTMRVDLKTGTYHMDTKMLVSQERSHVSRSDFRIDGDGMEFDMTSNQGKMIGNVRMVIYDSSTFNKPATDSKTDPKPESAKAGEQPAAAASAPVNPAPEPTPPPGK
jgi:hypothetical protein